MFEHRQAVADPSPDPGKALATVESTADLLAILDEEHARKQPDWTFGDHWSGKAPADRLDDHRSHHEEL